METSEANSHRRTLKVLVVCKQHENGKLLLSWWAAKLMSHWWLSLYYIYKYKEPYNQNLRACQTCFLTFSKTNNTLDCVKSVQIRSFFCSVFSRIQSKYGKIRTRKNSVFGHFLRSVGLADIHINIIVIVSCYLNVSIKYFDNVPS